LEIAAVLPVLCPLQPGLSIGRHQGLRPAPYHSRNQLVQILLHVLRSAKPGPPVTSLQQSRCDARHAV